MTYTSIYIVRVFVVFYVGSLHLLQFEQFKSVLLEYKCFTTYQPLSTLSSLVGVLKVVTYPPRPRFNLGFNVQCCTL